MKAFSKMIAFLDTIKDSRQIVKSLNVHRNLRPDFLIAGEAREEMGNETS
jgi:hypothetical protein